MTKPCHLLLLASLLSVTLAGCAAPNQHRREQLRSASALERARAAVYLAHDGDAQAVHALVDFLEDSDDVVRMYGILALQRLCGETFGYQYHAAETERNASILRWREALRDGRVRVRSTPVGLTAEDAAVTPTTVSQNGRAGGA